MELRRCIASQLSLAVLGKRSICQQPCGATLLSIVLDQVRCIAATFVPSIVEFVNISSTSADASTVASLGVRLPGHGGDRTIADVLARDNCTLWQTLAIIIWCLDFPTLDMARKAVS